MNPKKTLDFMRAIKVISTELDLFVEVRDSKNGPSTSVVVYEKNGHQVKRIAAIIIRKDCKEIKPGVARRIIHQLRQQLEKKTVDSVSDVTGKMLTAMIEKLITFFS